MGFGQLKGRDCELAGDCWEIVEELFQGVSTLEIIDQRLDWDACANEYRGTTQYVGIRVNDG